MSRHERNSKNVIIKSCSLPLLLQLIVTQMSIKKVALSISVLKFFKHLLFLRPCACMYTWARSCLKVESEVPVHVFSRPLNTSGSCYSLCDLSVVVLHPSPHHSSVGEQSNDWVLLHLPGPLAIWLFTPLLLAGNGLLLTTLLLFFPPIFFPLKRMSEAGGGFI